MNKIMLSLALACALTALGAARAEENTPPSKPAGQRPGALMDGMMEELVPGIVVERLNLTADQKARLDELSAAFRKEAQAWKAAHPGFLEAAVKARVDNNQEAAQKLAEQYGQLYEKQRAYLEQFKPALSDDQRKTLDNSFPRRRRPPPEQAKPAAR